MLIDSHCHLNFPDFADDRAAVIARAHDSGIGIMQTICTHMQEADEVLEIAKNNTYVYCSVGVHPHEADKAPLVEVDTLLEYATHSKVIGIGETGLDYYYEHSKRDAQQLSFRRHIEAARISGLPLIVHTRDAEADTLQILRDEMTQGTFKILIHCFTASAEFAKEVLELGAYISLSGIITFKGAKALHETVAGLPLDRLLVETDAPYLAPMPHRGSRNEPSFTRHTCERLAALQKIDAALCEQATTENFFRLFDKVPAF